MARILWQSSKGQGVVSALIAASIVATTAVGTTTLGVYLYHQSRRSQLVNQLVTTQSRVEAALLDKGQYAKTSEEGSNQRDQQLVAMAAGQATAARGLSFTSGPANKKQTVAVIGSRVSVDANGDAHFPEAPADPIFVDSDILCDTSGCRAAYRVGARLPANEPALASLGANTTFDKDGNALPSFNSAVDYSLNLPYDFFQQKQFPSTCDSSSDVLISGLVRTTGGVNCVKKAVDASTCPPDQIADGVKAVFRDGQYRLEMTCHPLAQTSCPDDYVLQRFDFAQLDRGKTFPGGVANDMHGQCVYRWKNDVPWQDTWPVKPTDSSSTVSLKTCNTDIYESQPGGGCSAVVTGQTDIPNCPYSCNCVEVTYANGSKGQSCDTCYRYAASHPVVSGTIDKTTNIATCNLQIVNDCGSTMTAYSTWSATCRVREWYKNNSLIRPITGGSL